MSAFAKVKSATKNERFPGYWRLDVGLNAQFKTLMFHHRLPALQF